MQSVSMEENGWKKNVREKEKIIVIQVEGPELF